ncbi:MAG: hypothetical protein ACO3CC_15110, partial [Alphaproteobacteria bacterium]
MSNDLATLAWLVEMGADEAIADAPVDRLAAAPAAPSRPAPAILAAMPADQPSPGAARPAIEPAPATAAAQGQSIA